MFSRNQIKHMISGRKAVCSCAQCKKDYVCSIYDAARTATGHQCKHCNTQISRLKQFTQTDLLNVLSYDELSGNITLINTSLSGKSGDVFGYPHSGGYITVCIGKKEYLAHRIIWFMKTGEWPLEVDHIDHDRSNNRWLNLRALSTSRDNQLNMGKRRNNSSGVNGVRILPSGRYSAFIMVNRKQISLGTYDILEDATAARLAADKQYGFHVNHGN